MARVPLQPRLTWVQNRSRPMPKGETTPMPEITTRMRTYTIWSSGRLIIGTLGLVKFDRLFVWTGGALFVASLAATVYTFAVVWGRSEGSPTLVAIAWDAALFAVFASHHSVF